MARNYRGLPALVDPVYFDGCVYEQVLNLSDYFSLIIEPVSSSRAAFEHFLRGIATLTTEQRTVRNVLDVLCRAVAQKMDYAVAPTHASEPLNSFATVLARAPAQVVAVALCISIVRAEFDIPIASCQIGMAALFEVADRLAVDPSIWMFDQADLLGPCEAFL